MGTGQRASYRLPLNEGEPLRPPTARDERAAFPEALLIENALWFCRLRWGVVFILFAFGVLGLFPAVTEFLGVGSALRAWPFVTGAVLALANLGFLFHVWAARRAAPESPDRRRGGAVANLWSQIVLDLAVLTLVVHNVGSLETYVAFAYLFHVVLACVFFSRASSLGVVVIAGGMYVTCVVLEQANVVASGGLFVRSGLRRRIEDMPTVAAVNVAGALVIWVVVWYLTSHLSGMVRQRDNQLAAANRRLLQLQEEKARDTLRMTHELKAPFAAIEAYAQLLVRGYCGELPERAVEVAGRMAARCRRLASEIQEMLQLTNLRSSRQKTFNWRTMDLARTLEECLAQIQPTAEQNSISFRKDLRRARVVAVEDHIRMLFSNLLSNAVHYSDRGGEVVVSCTPVNGGAVVSVEDQGIGMPGEKLPRIFEEYYRTSEAVATYKESTGLGLAIVRRVAQAHGISVTVESASGAGTKFTLTFPSSQDDRRPPSAVRGPAGRRPRGGGASSAETVAPQVPGRRGCAHRERGGAVVDVREEKEEMDDGSDNDR